MLLEIVAMPDCPYLPGTRLRLEEAIEHLALGVNWSEYVLGDEAAPPYAIGAASPTIFVDGIPVGGDDATFRLYRGVRLRRVTPFGTLLQMLQRAKKAAENEGRDAP